jgi:hypothetical protein
MEEIILGDIDVPACQSVCSRILADSECWTPWGTDEVEESSGLRPILVVEDVNLKTSLSIPRSAEKLLKIPESLCLENL